MRTHAIKTVQFDCMSYKLLLIAFISIVLSLLAKLCKHTYSKASRSRYNVRYKLKALSIVYIVIHGLMHKILMILIQKQHVNIHFYTMSKYK